MFQCIYLSSCIRHGIERICRKKHEIKNKKNSRLRLNVRGKMHASFITMKGVQTRGSWRMFA